LKEGTWHDAPKVLAPASRPGEIREAYAPFVIRKDGVFRMFYGPSDLRHATTTDLIHWKPEGTLFSGDAGARDPSVFCHKGRYVMIYVAATSVFARTSDDAQHWSAQPIEILRLDRRAPESPSMVEYNGQWYLFYCIYDGANEVNGAYDYRTYVHRSKNPFAFLDSTPVTELKSHAPEVFQDEDGDWHITSAEWPYRGISIAPLSWNSPKDR
jgi:beta-fructofuranosidase